MAQIGSLIEVAISPESTPGTYIAPVGSEYLPNAGADFDNVKESAMLTAGFGRIEDISQSKVSFLSGQGKIAFPLGINNAGNFLASLFGQFDGSPTGAGPYTHDYTLLNNNTHQSFTIVLYDPELGYRAFPYQMLDSWTIEAEKNGEYIVVDSSWKGASEQTGETPVASAYDTSEYFFTPDNMTVKVASNVAGLSGASAETLEKITMGGSKNVEVKGKIGSTGVDRVRNKRFGMTGQIVTELDGTTDQQFALTQGTKAMEVTFAVPSTSYALVFTFHQLAFETPQVSKDNDGLSILTRPFKLERASSGMVTASLVNGISAYPLT